MPVTRETLDAVEDQRDGAAVELRFDLTGLLRGPSGDEWSLRGQPTLRQDAASWEQLLEQAGYHETIRFAIPTARKTASPSWNTAVDRLRRAQDALVRGDARTAIAEVRPIIELLWPDLNDDAEVSGKRRERTLEQRFRGVVAELKEVTHPSHHEDEITQTMRWTRADAAATIAIVAALMHREGHRQPFE